MVVESSKFCRTKTRMWARVGTYLWGEDAQYRKALLFMKAWLGVRFNFRKTELIRLSHGFGTVYRATNRASAAQDVAKGCGGVERLSLICVVAETPSVRSEQH